MTSFEPNFESQVTGATEPSFAGGVSVPPNTLQLWEFRQTDPDKAVREVSRGQNVMYSERASDSNIEQRKGGSIKTFFENEPAFNIGSGLVTQGRAENIFIQNDISTWGGFTSFTGNSTPAPAQDQPDVDFVDFEDVRLVPSTDCDDATAYVSSFWLKSNIPADVKVRNASAQDELVSLTTEWRRYSFTGVTVGTSTNTLLIDARFSQGLGAAGLEIATFSGNLVLGEFLSSDIYTFGGPAIRADDLNDIPCFLEKGVYLDERGQSGSSDFICQVSSQTNLVFISGTTKYFGLGEVRFINARVIFPGGKIAKVSGFVDVDNLTIESIDYPDDLPLNTDLLCTIDFSISDFFPDESAVGTLRTNAGDTVASLPAVEPWPANDFELSGEFIFNGSPGPFPRVFEMDFDADDKFRLFISPAVAGEFILNHLVGGVSKATVVILGVDSDPGDVILWKATKSLALGATLRIENVTKSLAGITNNAGNTDPVLMPSSMRISNDLIPANPLNATHLDILLKPSI